MPSRLNAGATERAAVDMENVEGLVRTLPDSSGLKSGPGAARASSIIPLAYALGPARIEEQQIVVLVGHDVQIPLGEIDSDLAANRTALTAAVTAQAPELLKARGVGPVVAATVLHAWSHPGRIHSEAAFAALAGVSPLPASSGNTRRHRLNRGGDRRLNRALYTVALTRLGHDPRTRDYLARRTTEGSTRREIIPSSTATSAANSSGSSRPPSHARSPLDTHRSISLNTLRCRIKISPALNPDGAQARGRRER